MISDTIENMNLNYKLIILSAVGVVVVIAFAGYYLYSQNQKAQNPQNTQAAQEEVKRLVLEVGKLIDLPKGEDPTVATVTDISKLSDQPFFQKAKNGDKVLIYTNAKKAILYDPSAKKVLDVAPINIGTQSAQTQNLPKVVLRNGTTTVGLTGKTEIEIKKTIPIEVVTKDNAEKDNYDNTTIVVLNDSFKGIADDIAEQLKGSIIGSLPAGEKKPINGDILIILGKDRM